MDDRQHRLRQKAIAIKYNPEEAAPKVTAKGAGVVAEKIKDKAKETDVNIYQDAELVSELTKMDLGTHIPPDLYEVVAQILVFISDLDRQAGKQNVKY
ncbi:MAG: EscU/YscU/HrcU family type III secretion system export apparatus switch protein [Turicibacter sp.]|nr:EscU/YscU/HrcU family type III secretion system export apparatus switch protein [Turicibacter sp.]